jgi:hypothetical protein
MNSEFAEPIEFTWGPIGVLLQQGVRARPGARRRDLARPAGQQKPMRGDETWLASVLPVGSVGGCRHRGKLDTPPSREWNPNQRLNTSAWAPNANTRGQDPANLFVDRSGHEASRPPK